MMVLPNLVEYPVPAIMKPEPLWTGKQALSLVLPDINLAFRDREEDKEDENVEIRGGQLVSGILTKKHLGPASGGIIHVIAKLLSPGRALEFLNDIQSLANTWLQWQGLSVGLSDCRCDPHTQEKIARCVQICVDHVHQVESMGKELNIPFPQREQTSSGILSKMLAVAGGHVQKSTAHGNVLKMMIRAGSKGNLINLAQISGFAGQQSLEGQRLFNKHFPGQRMLPYFPNGCDNVYARGFIAHSFLQGLTPSEAFFHNDLCKQIPLKTLSHNTYFFVLVFMSNLAV